MIQKYRKAINPPYNKQDLPVILLTLCFLLIIPITLIFLNRDNLQAGQAASDKVPVVLPDQVPQFVVDGKILLPPKQSRN